MSSLDINRPGSNTDCVPVRVPNNTRPHSTSLFEQRWNVIEKLTDSIRSNPVELSIQQKGYLEQMLDRNMPDHMNLAVQRHIALEQLPGKHRNLLRHWDGLSTLHPEQITSLSRLTIDEIRDMFGIVPAQVKKSTHTFGELIVRGNSRNNTVNDYIRMNPYGMLIMRKSCYVVFPTCRTDSIGLHQKVYPQRIFFGGECSEIPIDHGVFRMISSIEIYESPEFTDTYRLADDAVELID